MLRCAILDDYQRVALASAPWGKVAGRVELRVLHEPIVDPARLAAAIGDCEIVVATRERTRFDEAVLKALPALRLLVTTGMRNASIDLACANALGITVCGTRGWPGHTVELTFALMLALMRRLREESQSFAQGNWQVGLGRSLNGATLGVVGLGTIGTRVASIARAFDMRVVAWSRSLTPARCAELDIEYAADLDPLLRAADVVTLHVALNAATRGLIGERQLACMKRDAFLVNTSRGPVVDEAALVEALRTKSIAGAALDVFDREPLPREHPLRTLDNVLGTPHIGYVTRENYAVAFSDAVDGILAFLDGQPQRVLCAPADPRVTGRP
jgi:phosphoglycerate dehydrogenase-like enzyme